MSMIETSFRSQPIALNVEPVAAEGAELREAAQGPIIDGDGMSLLELEKFLLDIRDEPVWRPMANRCVDYYDHNQLTDDVLEDFRKSGLPPLVINLIHPTINTVLGMEAKTRTDWQVTFEDDALEEVALAVGKKVTEAERTSNADRAISDAYAGQIKAGLHWVEVGWHSDPFAEARYRVRPVHRREIWWDWRIREIDEWRYLVRKQRFDADRLMKSFPKFKDMIDSAMQSGTTWQEYALRLDEGTGLGQVFDLERAMTFEDQEWRDFTRKQLAVFEVWYRKYVTGYVARVGDTTIEVDQENPRHMLAIAHGAMQPRLATYPKLRQAIFIGPQRVIDRPSPYPHRKLPYVPFFGYREDLTGIPYGLIRGMISSQDEINSRRSKMRAMLNARRVEADSDALDLTVNTHDDAADEVSRHDSYIVLNPNRKNLAHGFNVSDNADLSSGQGLVLQESKNEIHQTTGVFPPMAGENRSGMSGLAIHSLVEQGTQTLAEINDNYIWGRREVGDLVMALVKFDSRHEHSVMVGEGKNKKTITLNKRAATTWDNNTGDPVTPQNMVENAQLKLVLDDVPSTPAWRQQQSAHLAEITKGLPPQMQAFVVPFYLEGTDLKDRKKIAALLRKQMGIPEDGPDQAPDPQVAQLQQQLQQVQAQGQQAIGELTKKADAAMAEAQQLRVKLAGKEGEVAVKATEAETERKRVDAEIQNERLTALASIHHAEDPKGTQTGIPEEPMESAIQGVLEEMAATMRGGLQEFHGRLAAIEDHIKKQPAAPPT